MPRPRILNHRRTNHDANGLFPRICPRCGRNFRTDEERAVYCSERCQKSAQNARNHQRRKEREQA